VDEFDVIIVGGGLVGLSLARALQRSGLCSALVDRAATLCDTDESGWDSRVYAISPGSEAFLRGLGAWPEDTARIHPVYEMQVFGDRRPGSLHFSAYQAHVAHLASIAEGRLLTRALWTALQGQAQPAPPRGGMFGGLGRRAPAADDHPSRPGYEEPSEKGRG
jgi:2-polyprenyl-6-methoxyphenol hydroxylase-like FAD-dependent oxidoreductase